MVGSIIYEHFPNDIVADVLLVRSVDSKRVFPNKLYSLIRLGNKSKCILSLCLFRNENTKGM